MIQASLQKSGGASILEIEKLREYAGIPLPGFFKEYLLKMGHHHGGVDIGRNEAKTDIGSLIHYYEEYILPGVEKTPPNSIVIAVYGYLINEVSLQYTGADEPVVNYSDGEEVEFLYAGSLEKLLYQIAYMLHHFDTFPEIVSCVGSMTVNRVEPIQNIALELGFKPHWFSDTRTFCADKEDAAIWIMQGEHAPSLSIAAKKRKTIKEIGKILKRETGVAFAGRGKVGLVP